MRSAEEIAQANIKNSLCSNAAGFRDQDSGIAPNVLNKGTVIFKTLNCMGARGRTICLGSIAR
jgi:hypothetical protein